MKTDELIDGQFYRITSAAGETHIAIRNAKHDEFIVGGSAGNHYIKDRAVQSAVPVVIFTEEDAPKPPPVSAPVRMEAVTPGVPNGVKLTVAGVEIKGVTAITPPILRGGDDDVMQMGIYVHDFEIDISNAD